MIPSKSWFEGPRVVWVPIEIKNRSTLIVWVPPPQLTALWEGVEAIIHLGCTAAASVFIGSALVAVSVLGDVYALAEDLVWLVLIPGLFAHGAANQAVRKIIGGFFTDHNRFFLGLAARIDLEIGNSVPVSVALTCVANAGITRSIGELNIGLPIVSSTGCENESHLAGKSLRQRFDVVRALDFHDDLFHGVDMLHDRSSDLPKFLVLIRDEVGPDPEPVVEVYDFALLAEVIRSVLRVIAQTGAALGRSIANSVIARMRCHLKAIPIGLHEGDRRAFGVVGGDGRLNVAVVVQGNQVDASCAARLHRPQFVNMVHERAPEERWPVGELGRSIRFSLEPYLGVLAHPYDLIFIDVGVRISLINIEGMIRWVPEHDPIPSLSSECQHAGRKESLKHLVYLL